jgi:HK97 gp10 family phage protein
MVEFGTSKMSPKPFMRPAFEAKKNEAVDAIRDYLAKRIPEEVAKLPGAK